MFPDRATVMSPCDALQESLSSPPPGVKTRDARGRRQEGDEARAVALSRALRLALGRGQCALAHELGEAAFRLEVMPAGLSEALARLRVAEGKLHRALAVLESADTSSPTIRLLRAACLIELGQPFEAHADLAALCDLHHAPAGARHLLAILEWSLGDAAAADEALRPRGGHGNDPLGLQLLLTMAVICGEPEQAHTLARRLEQWCLFPTLREGIRVFLASLGEARVIESLAPGDDMINRLARELIEAEILVPVLLEAQRRRFDRLSARLLELALARALPAFAQPAVAYAALTELALRLDGPTAARVWLEAGLVRHPMSTELRRLERDRAAEVEPATPIPSPPLDSPVLGTIGPTPDADENSTTREQAA